MTSFLLPLSQLSSVAPAIRSSTSTDAGRHSAADISTAAAAAAAAADAVQIDTKRRTSSRQKPARRGQQLTGTPSVTKHRRMTDWLVDSRPSTAATHAAHFRGIESSLRMTTLT